MEITRRKITASLTIREGHDFMEIDIDTDGDITDFNTNFSTDCIDLISATEEFLNGYCEMLKSLQKEFKSKENN